MAAPPYQQPLQQLLATLLFWARTYGMYMPGMRVTPRLQAVPGRLITLVITQMLHCLFLLQINGMLPLLLPMPIPTRDAL